MRHVATQPLSRSAKGAHCLCSCIWHRWLATLASSTLPQWMYTVRVYVYSINKNIFTTGTSVETIHLWQGPNYKNVLSYNVRQICCITQRPELIVGTEKKKQAVVTSRYQYLLFEALFYTRWWNRICLHNVEFKFTKCAATDARPSIPTRYLRTMYCISYLAACVSSGSAVGLPAPSLTLLSLLSATKLGSTHI